MLADFDGWKNCRFMRLGCVLKSVKKLTEHYNSDRGGSTIEKKLAERVGFEPTLEFPLNTLSKRAPSATRPSLRRILIGTFTADGPRVGRQPDAFHYIWQLAIGD